MFRAALEAFIRILQLLSQVIIEVDRRRRAKASKARQENANAAKADIASAFNYHFGGLRNDTSGASSDTTDKAGNQGKG